MDLQFGEVWREGAASLGGHCEEDRVGLLFYGDFQVHAEQIVHFVHFLAFVFVHTVDVGVHCEGYGIVPQNRRKCFVVHATLQRSRCECVSQGMEGEVPDAGVF